MHTSCPPDRVPSPPRHPPCPCPCGAPRPGSVRLRAAQRATPRLRCTRRRASRQAAQRAACPRSSSYGRAYKAVRPAVLLLARRLARHVSALTAAAPAQLLPRLAWRLSKSTSSVSGSLWGPYLTVGWPQQPLLERPRPGCNWAPPLLTRTATAAASPQITQPSRPSGAPHVLQLPCLTRAQATAMCLPVLARATSWMRRAPAAMVRSTNSRGGVRLGDSLLQQCRALTPHAL